MLLFTTKKRGSSVLRPASIINQRSFTASSTNLQTPTDCRFKKPSRDLRGKVAIVTGAGSQGDNHIGNGRATALLLAEDGASVVCVDKQLSLAQRTVSMFSTQSPTGCKEALALDADVTSEQDCRHVIDATLAEFGRVDILVNVVGIMGTRGTAVDVDLTEWAEGLKVNVTSMMLMAKFAIPAMLKNERTDEKPIRGSIVNIGSVAGLLGGTPHLLYPTSKGAVINMTRSMAAHHGADGIRVNCVCPGMLFTPMMYGAGMTPEVRESRRKRSLLGTEGNAWDCASAIRFLAGDEARWITGAVLTVDAGATAAVSVSTGTA
ncbi:dehydrogenase with different specificitie [Podospora didyma]|uniref:Dehydrogenase with different specificitie n=1 Tax=Podospora didyma TaxID=330526 RepID=A0AAE0TV59_9PEZI|nr:dehydrogenase with different specificitie [Podospora didyma]